MVARITSGASPAGALYYNKAKIDRGEASLLDCRNTLLTPGDGFDIHRTLQTFDPYLTANRRTKMPTFHVSLNPSPEDQLTDEELRQIAFEYMERMGYGEQPYFVFKHTDIARAHLHIVSLRVDSEGRKLPHDFEARRSMQILRSLELKYGLHPALRGQERHDTERTLQKVDYRASDIKHRMASVIRTVLHTYHCSSFGELRTLLELFNVGIREQVGVIGARHYAGILYQALSEEGYRAGVPIKASRMGRDIGYEALQRYYERSQQHLAKSGCLEPLRDKVSQALRNAADEASFVRMLEKENVTAVLRHTDKGRIYGVTFVDHMRGVVANGSVLGDAFCANVLEWRLNGESQDITQQKSPESTSTLDAVAEALDDLLTVRGEEEEQLRQQRRRRKKRRHRM